MNLKNKTNEYVEMLGESNFDKISKAQFAAIAISYFVNHENITGADKLMTALLKEIEILKDNEIIK